MGVASFEDHSRARRAGALRSRSAGAGVPLVAIIGRDDDVARVQARFEQGGVRLVTLSGPGGIGKTRLALEVASRIQHDYADGAVFVPLAGEHDPARVPGAIAHVLGIVSPEHGDIGDVVVSALRSQHLLLVLDNVEQVAEGATPWLMTLLSHCPRLHLLVTSRIGLRLAGEHRIAVPPLALPAELEHRSVEAIRQSPAVRLFVQRASEARDDFILTETNARAVAAICERLDGVPLAIELAAARTVVMSPATLLQRIEGQEEVLADTRADLPERHRTIALAIGWSYGLLSDVEQRLFRRLAVFTGGFPLEAVEWLETGVANEDVASAVDVLQTLINHSMVSHVGDANGEMRFRMLEPVRAYAQTQLAAADEEAAARSAHAAWCMVLAARGWREMKGRDQVAWIDRLESEHANLRAATEWLLQTDRVEDAISLALDLSLFRHFRGHTADLASLYDRLLAHSRIAAPGLARGKALLCRGSLAQTQYDPAVAIETLREAIALLREHGAHEYEAAAQWLLGNVLRFTVGAEAAEPGFTACMMIGRELGEPRSIGVGLSHLGVTATMRGDFERAERLLRDAMQVADDAGDTWVRSMTWVHLAQLAIAQGDAAGAEARLREAEPLVRALGDRVGLLRLRVMIAEIARQAGNEDTAEVYVEESLADAWALSDRAWAGRILLDRSRRAAQRGARAAALADIREALRLYVDMEQPAGVARCLGMLAGVAMAAGHADQAARLLGMADGQHPSPEREGSTVDAVISACREQVRAALGAAGFEVAHATGLAAGREAAIDEAMTLSFAEADGPRRAPAPPLPDGVSTFTRRELEVLRLLSDGLSNEEIAAALYISVRTTAGHVANILAKLGLKSRTAAVAYAIRNGLA